jgi:hypothetical protein
MKELILGFYGHCVATMRDVEVEKVKLAMKPVRALYGETKVSEFKAVAFKAVRSHLIKAGLAISTIRDRMGTIRRMIAWGVEHEMAPADSLQRIEANDFPRAVECLQRSRPGRSRLTSSLRTTANLLEWRGSDVRDSRCDHMETGPTTA